MSIMKEKLRILGLYLCILLMLPVVASCGGDGDGDSPAQKQQGGGGDDAKKLVPSECYKYTVTLNVLRNSQTGFTNFVIETPCPQSNEYQEVYNMKYNTGSNWKEKSIAENQNKFMEIVMDGNELKNVSKNFNLSYTFEMSTKTIDIDFSSFKNADGSWKVMPEYDTSAKDYIDNTKQSGDYVVPGNSKITEISDKLFAECGYNRLAYAERCYTYVANTYKYLNPMTGLHKLANILSAGGGDCGNMSSIYVSLLRAKGIPARHVIAIGGTADYHVWSEFLIQGFGWVPVDVTYKNGNPKGDYYGKYNLKMVIVQKGVNMDYDTAEGVKTLPFMQQCYWWWYCDSEVKVEDVKHNFTKTYLGTK